MTSQNSDPFETLLTSALRSRPEQVPQFDLAAEAIARAARLQASENRLIRLAFWRRITSVAATLFIAAVLIAGYLKLPASSSTDTSLTDTTTTTTSIDLTTLGISALVITLILIVLATLLTTERPQFRLAPA